MNEWTICSVDDCCAGNVEREFSRVSLPVDNRHIRGDDQL